MVFVRSFGLTTRSYVDAETTEQLKNQLNLPEELCYYRNGKPLEENDALEQNDVVEVVAKILGGKGGFGSMLRALGNQIQKTTNKEACRDLSGRRLRDINDEKRLKNYVSKKAEREREEKEKKDAKLKKLHKLVTEGESKHEFHDEKYDKDREAATDRVHEALEQVYNDPALKPGTSGIKRKAEDDKKKEPVPAKKGLTMDGWVGDFNESDLDSSSDEEDSDESKGSQG